jgi:hypothetical protein
MQAVRNAPSQPHLRLRSVSRAIRNCFESLPPQLHHAVAAASPHRAAAAAAARVPRCAQGRRRSDATARRRTPSPIPHPPRRPAAPPPTTTTRTCTHSRTRAEPPAPGLRRSQVAGTRRERRARRPQGGAALPDPTPARLAAPPPARHGGERGGRERPRARRHGGGKGSTGGMNADRHGVATELRWVDGALAAGARAPSVAGSAMATGEREEWRRRHAAGGRARIHHAARGQPRRLPCSAASRAVAGRAARRRKEGHRPLEPRRAMPPARWR